MFKNKSKKKRKNRNNSMKNQLKTKNPNGRPREHDRDQVGSDLVEWAKLDDSLNLNKFCAIKEIPPSNLSIWANQCDNFRKAYELAKCFIGYRREIKLTNNELHVKAYDLNASTYDYFLKEERRQQARFESELRNQENKPISTESLENLKLLHNQLESLRSDSNKATNNISSEDKS